MNCKKITIIYCLFVLTAIHNLTGCFYSFTGASVPSHLKTVAIPVFDDKSGYGDATLRESFTRKLTQKFIDDNTLMVAPKADADAILECTIVSVSPEVPQSVTSSENGTETVSVRRITVTVRAVFKDLVKKKTISEKRYSDYGDFDADTDVVIGRKQAVESAIDKISDDILLGTVSNW